MSFTNHNSKQSEPLRGRIRGKRGRMYTFGIVTLSVFLLVAVVWPLRVREFSSTSGVQVNLHPELAVNQEQLKTTVLNSLARLTTDQRLDQAVAEIGKATVISSPLLTEVDRETLQNQLRIRLHQTSEARRIAISLELVGRGSNDEIELVNHLASGLVSELGVEADRARVAQSRQQLADELERIDRQVGNQQQGIRTDLIPQLEQVEFKLEQIIAGMGQRQPLTPNPSPVSRDDGSTRRVVNAHLASASQAMAQPGISELQAVSTERALLTAERLARSLEAIGEQNRSLMDEIRRAPVEAETESPVRLVDFRRAQQSLPIGGTPTLTQIVLLLFSAMLVGGAISMLLDPAVSFQPFMSAEQLTESTGIPVIGSVSKLSRRSEGIHWSQQALAVVLRCCEIFLVVAAFILVGSSLMKAGFLPEFFSNPFHAAARLFSH